MRRDGRGGRNAPGSGLLRVAAALVPWWRRDEWLAEWQAELAWAARRGGGAMVLRVRALSALRDALWLRRRHGRQAVLAQDVRQSVRALRRRPAYAAAVVLTLAIGIGGATAIFSVVDAVVLRPLPFADAARLVQMWRYERDFGVPDVKPAQVEGWRAHGELFESVEAYADESVIVTGHGEPTDENAALLTAGVFRQLGIAPIRGRVFTAEEAASGARVAVVAEAFWRGRLGGEAAVVGSTIELDGETWEIVGVMPRSFRFPLGGRSFWLPLAEGSARARQGLAKLRPGVTLEVAQARVDALAAQLDAEAPLADGWRVLLQPLDRRASGPRDNRPLRVLGLAVLGVLLIACVNAANLLLVEGATRARELAVRSALGGTRSRIVRLLVTECVLLAGLAAILGVAIGAAGVRVLQAIAPTTYTIFGPNDFRLDVRVLAFAALLAACTGVLFGVGPALAASSGRARLTGTERAGTGTKGLRRTRTLLAGAELALAMALLVSASLLIRSFTNLMGTDLGVRATNLSVLRAVPPSFRYADAQSQIRFMIDVAERVRSIPGVQAVTLAESLPPNSGFSFGYTLEPEGAPAPAEGQPELLPVNAVDDAFFSVLGIPLLAGRTFDARDAEAGEPVAVIDVDLARFLWPDAAPETAVGRRFRLDAEQPWLSVIGVVGDVLMLGLPGSQMAEPCAGVACAYEIYRPIRQLARRWPHELAIRTAGEVPGLARSVREAVWSVDPAVPVSAFETIGERMRYELAQPRFLLRLVAAFTFVAVVLAALGVYAVLAYAVAQRTREFGVRVALGARGEDVMRLVLAGGFRLAAAGVVAGALVAFVAVRVLRSLLHEVGPGDPVSIVVAALVLGAVALLAAALPARRALRVSPMEALRHE